MTDDDMTPAERQHRKDMKALAIESLKSNLLLATGSMEALLEYVKEVETEAESIKRGQAAKERDLAAREVMVEAAQARVDGLLSDQPGYTKRLESALHRRMAHPDYEYATTKGQRKAWDVTPPEQGDGPVWEMNKDYHDGWERFEYHEEAYWRRPVLGARPCPYCSRFGNEETIEVGQSCPTCGWEPGE